MYRSPVSGSPMEKITRDDVEGYFDANTGQFYTEKQCKEMKLEKVVVEKTKTNKPADKTEGDSDSDAGEPAGPDK